MKIVERKSSTATYMVEVSFAEMFKICKELGVSDGANAPAKGDVVNLDTFFQQKQALVEEITRIKAQNILKDAPAKPVKTQLNG